MFKVEKILYFNERSSTRKNDIVYKIYDIVIDCEDGPFKSKFILGTIEMEFDEELKIISVEKYDINIAYNCLDLLLPVLNIALSLVSCLGYRILVIGNNIIKSEDDERIIRNLSFETNTTSSDDMVLYTKDTKNLYK